MILPIIQFYLSDEWIINRNEFTEICPEQFINDDFEYKWELNEDILQITNTNRNRIIDLGWYPEFRFEGQYCVKLVVYVKDEELQPENWEQPIIKYYSRNINDVKMMIEGLINKVDQGIL
jgi:hypothetical protein